MTICVIGGGNIGTLLTAEFAKKGFDVKLFTQNNIFSDRLKVYNSENNLLFETSNFFVTDDIKEAINNAEYIWITYPSFLFGSIGKKLEPYIKAGQKIVCVPGSGGAEFAFFPLIKHGVILCGLQRVHCISRIKENGNSVYALGRKQSVSIGTVPSNYSKLISNDVEVMLSIKCMSLPNYLSVTLTPSNPILHTSRLYSMFKDYSDGIYYQRNFLFYKEWTNYSSQVLFECDDELQELCKKMPEYDLSNVVSLKIHYESQTPEALTKKLSSIPAYQKIKSPMLKKEEGWVPDFTSRYFVADFNYGLKIIIEIAHSIGFKVPTMEKIWSWYTDVNPNAKKNSFSMDSLKPEIYY